MKRLDGVKRRMAMFHMILRAKNGVTITTLARRFGVHKRTVQKDLVLLEFILGCGKSAPFIRENGIVALDPDTHCPFCLKSFSE